MRVYARLSGNTIRSINVSLKSAPVKCQKKLTNIRFLVGTVVKNLFSSTAICKRIIETIPILNHDKQTCIVKRGSFLLSLCFGNKLLRETICQSREHSTFRNQWRLSKNELKRVPMANGKRFHMQKSRRLSSNANFKTESLGNKITSVETEDGVWSIRKSNLIPVIDMQDYTELDKIG